ncbi:MAG: hypothetical protein ACLGGX_11330 [Bdellovibrionia bacterium]
MQTGTSFKKILNEKLISSEPSGSTSHFEPVAPAHFAYLLGQIPRYQFKTTSTKGYKKSTHPSAETTIVTPTLPAHWSADQISAYYWLNEQGFELRVLFDKADLKRAFRSLAKKLHPDSGGNVHSFLQLKSMIQQLEAVALTATP